jgi:hypothetical protein
MKVLNNLRIPYVLIHDIDPIDFAEDKSDKTDKEQHSLRMFKENDKIMSTRSPDTGKIVRINPALEPIIGVSASQVDKHGKVRAAYFKYDGLPPIDYPPKVKELMKLLVDWTPEQSIHELAS